jgi:hypothetical protein
LITVTTGGGAGHGQTIHAQTGRGGGGGIIPSQLLPVKGNEH